MYLNKPRFTEVKRKQLFKILNGYDNIYIRIRGDELTLVKNQCILDRKHKFS